jgi:hypothetical protein
VKNFSLSLLAFHLCQTLDEPPDRAAEGGDAIWETLVELGKNTLPFLELQKLKQQLICYDRNGQFVFAKNSVNEWLSPQQRPIKLLPIATKSGFQLGGKLEPFLLNDTYAVDLSLSPTDPDIDIESLAEFKVRNLLPDRIHASLGQAIWLFGAVEPDTDCKALAEKFAIACLGETSLQLGPVAGGKLLGIPIYEYQVREADAPEALPFHIVVWLNNIGDKFDQAKVSHVYNWLRDLLWSRYKVIAVDAAAKEQYRNARTLYADLEGNIQKLYAAIKEETNRLEQLNRLLKEDLPLQLLKYRTCVRDLQAHRTTIAVNLQNYQTCLSHVLQAGDSFPAWQELGDRKGKRILTQVQTDLSYLEPGQAFFADAMNTVRAVAAIEQVESDRQLRATLDTEREENEKSDRSIERTIQILGAGLGAGGIVASGISSHIQTPMSIPSAGLKEIHPAIHTLIWSVLAAIVVGGLVAWGNGAIARWQQRKSNKNNTNSGETPPKNQNPP